MPLQAPSFGIDFDMQLDSVGRFFKYCDIDGARYILRDGTLKFSVASKFNDPFDASIQTLFAYDPIEKLAELQLEQINILLSDEDFPPFSSGKNQQLVSWLRANLSTKTQAEKDDLKKAFLAESADSIWNLEHLRQVEVETLDQVKKLFSSDAIFCASLTNDNHLLWSHYAQDHSGVALEFAPSVEKDSILRLMTPVTYSDERPILYKSPKDFLFKSMFIEVRDIIQEFTQSIMFTKDTRWLYEQEVRVYIAMYVPENKTYSLQNYHSEELKAIYLGCRTEPSSEKAMVKFAHSQNNNVNVFKMKMGKANYNLTPIRMNVEHYL
jgi:Protein of unknown function (DUF2971)